jgi:hypothetical protein
LTVMHDGVGKTHPIQPTCESTGWEPVEHPFVEKSSRELQQPRRVAAEDFLAVASLCADLENLRGKR